MLVEGQPDGVVVDQNPRAHDKAAKGSTIDVKLEILTSSHTSGVPTERGLLRAAALNLGFGLCPN